MKARGLIVLGLLAVLSGCPDPDAGAEMLTGRGALTVEMERVLQGIPRGDAWSGAGFPGGAGAWINMDIRDLPPLQDGYQYQLWLVGGRDALTQRIHFQWEEQRLDTVDIDPFTELPIVEWVDSVWVIENGDTISQEPLHTGIADSIVVPTRGRRHVIRVEATELLDSLDITFEEYTHIVLSVGETGVDANPLERHADGRYKTSSPMFFRYMNPETEAISTSGVLRFGFMPEYVSDATLMRWVAAGSAQAEFLNVVGFGIQFDRFSRPPLGYFYGLWLVDGEDPEATNYNLGPVRSPAPEYYSLFNADIERIMGVTPTVIFQGGFWADWEDLDVSMEDVNTVWITIEPKLGPEGALANTVVLETGIPGGLHLLPFDDVFR